MKYWLWLTMQKRGKLGYSRQSLAVLLLASIGVLGIGEVGKSQLVPDGTLGVEQTTVLPNTSVNGLPADLIEGGALRGANLFQSFTEFNVSAGQQVYFSNPGGVQNILTRITGANGSTIAGTLGVLGPANLFLINPNGLTFGPNARLDIRGSFVASTAERLTFPDGSDFSAKNPQVAPLLTVNLPVGLQYGSQPGAIASTANLSVGQDLTLAGGSVSSTGQLLAPTGRVTVTGVAGDVQVKALAAQSAMLSSARNLTLAESQLQTTGDLTLLAQGTLQVRDSAANPFIAAAGGQLLIQGNQAVDIFALNHSDSGFFSGADLVLRSSTPVLGDARYSTGGNFRIEQLNGQLGSLYSPYDPIIRAADDVSFDTYTGASLHIIAGGSVSINAVTIDAADAGGLIETVALSNGSSLQINGTAMPTLDIRAGTTNYGAVGVTSPGGTFTPTAPNPNPSAPASIGASITIGSITLSNSPGLVFLSNQYVPSANPGSITVGSITNPGSAGPNSGVIIDSRGGLIVNGLIAASDPSLLSANGGTVSLNAVGNIALNGNVIGNVITSQGLLGGQITVRSLADVFVNGTVQNNTTTSVVGSKGGSINIQGRSITSAPRTGSALVQTGALTTNAGDISIQASDRLAIQTATIQSRVTSSSTANFGRTGNILLQAPQLSVTAGGQVRNGLGNAGQSGTITLIGTNIFLDGATTTITNQVTRRASAGNLTINTGTLTLSGGANLQTLTQATNSRAGDILIQATDRVTLANSFLTSSVQTVANNAVGGTISISAPILSLSGGNAFISSLVTSSASGQGGNMVLQTGALSLSNGASISSSTAGITGNAGSIQINGGPTGAVDLLSNSRISSETTSVGAGGAIAITTGRFNATGGSQLRASTSNLGAAGQIQVSANQFQVTDGAQLTASTTSSGSGGSVTVNAGSFTMNSGGQIRTSTSGTGAAGRITVAANQFEMTDNALLSASTSGSGNGGSISVDSGTFRMRSQAQIRTSTSSSGNAGDITVLARDLIDIDGANTGLFADTLPGATGQGGNIFIDPPVVRLTNGATVSVNSLGSGNAGNLFLQARSLTLQNGASLTAFSASGLGGNIALDVQDVLLMRLGSLISAEAGNNGDGGNITINSGFVVAVPDEASNIIANAFRGRGGNINIRTQTIFGFSLQRFQPPRSLISASSQFGLQGTITITTPGIDPSRGIVALPSGIVDASKLVAQGCTTEIADSTGTGRFVVTGRGGLPPAPGDSLGQDVIWEDVPAAETAGPRSQTSPPALAQGWSISDQGTVTLLPQPLNRCYAR